MTKFISISFLIILMLSGCETAEKSYTIYTIGDSTMANKKESVYPETGWCQVLGDYFDESVTVSNHAVNGRSSKSFIDEGRWQTVLDSLKNGDVVFIQFGHNDKKDHDSTRYTVPFGSYSKNLRRFVDESRDKGATPILFTSIVRRHFGEDGKLIDTHMDYPVATRKVGEELNVPVIDLQKLTEKAVNELGDEPSKALYLWLDPTDEKPKGKQDDTHLCVEGAKFVSHMALEECQNQALTFTKQLKHDF